MKMRTLGRWLLRGVVALVVIYFGVALALSAWPAPGFDAPAVHSEEAAKAQGLSLEQVNPFEERRFTTRDGETLYCVERMVITAGAVFDWLATGLQLLANFAQLPVRA